MTVEAMLAAELAPQFLEDHIKANHVWAQQKFDGHRLLVSTGDEPDYFNRRGERFNTKIPHELNRQLSTVRGWFLDGEYCDGVYNVFDCLASPTGITPNDMYAMRYEALEQLFALWPVTLVNLVYTARSVPEKRALVKKVQQQRGEGIILRNRNGMYRFGQRQGVWKVKFWKSCDVIVYNPGREGKLSAGVAVWTEQGKLRDVGAVTLTQARLDALAPGDVIEVKYLYASDDYRLVQPAFLRKRDDKLPQDCTLDQLEQTDRSLQVK